MWEIQIDAPPVFQASGFPMPTFSPTRAPRYPNKWYVPPAYGLTTPFISKLKSSEDSCPIGMPVFTLMILLSLIHI